MTKELDLALGISDQNLVTTAFNMPPQYLEPEIRTGSQGTWRCDPRFLNHLKVDGRDIPATEVVLFRALEISWRAAPNEEIYVSPCPRPDRGGAIPKLRLHALLFGVGLKCIDGQSSFAIDNSGPVWIAVNDTNYGDNTGHILVQVKWQ